MATSVAGAAGAIAEIAAATTIAASVAAVATAERDSSDSTSKIGVVLRSLVMSTRQQLLWMPPTPPDSARAGGSVPYDGPRPTRVWTVIGSFSESQGPTLPFAPVHLGTAFLEDFVHDWVIRSGRLHYYSRAVDLRVQGVWLLLEFET